jgi:hypothetical protein
VHNLTYHIDSILPSRALAVTATSPPLTLAVFGANFTETSQIKCRLTIVDSSVPQNSAIPIELSGVFVSSSELRCIIPAHVAATVWVQVSVDGGDHWTRDNVTLTFFDVRPSRCSQFISDLI